MTLLYLYIEVQRRLGDTDVAFARASPDLPARACSNRGHRARLDRPDRALHGVAQLGGRVARRRASRRCDALPPFVGQLPVVVGIEPLLVFPSAIFVMTFMSFFIGTFLQLMWEDLPITEPL